MRASNSRSTKRRSARPASGTANRETPREYSSPPCYLHEFEPDLAANGTVDIQLKRIYDAPSSDDGLRVLVDRIWPRGVNKQKAALDDWLKDIAPSTELRKWFDHDPARWAEFVKRYRAELSKRTSQIDDLRQRARHQRLTLLYSARTPIFNHAVVLKQVLQAGRE